MFSSFQPQSFSLSAIIFGIFVASVVFIAWASKKEGAWTDSQRRKVIWGGLTFGLLLSVYAYFMDADMREKTLFEVSDKWEVVGNRQWLFEVQHPGVKHSLLIHPIDKSLTGVSNPIKLHVNLGPQNAPPLIDTTTDHPTELRSSSGRNYDLSEEWSSKSLSFTPTSTGYYRLIVTPVDGGTPGSLHLRIEDPKLRDGKRAKGY